MGAPSLVGQVDACRYIMLENDMWISIGNKSWTVSLWNFLKPVWEYIYEERVWFFPVFATLFATSVTLLVMVILYKPCEVIPFQKIRHGGGQVFTFDFCRPTMRLTVE